MGTIVASTIIDKAATQLLDQGNTRWTRAELLGWLNDGQRQITLMSPQTSNKVSTIKLVAGTRQNIPADGWSLLDVFRYMGTDGLKPGRAVRLISRELIDAYNPDWHSASRTNAPQNFLFDDQDQTAFYVYPPNTGNGYVQINYAPVPADLPNEAAAIAINDIYQTTLLDYVLYRANSKDAEYAPGIALASGYLTTFMGALQTRDKNDRENSPNLGLRPQQTPAEPGGES
jgi:hypothetical protein